MKHSQQNVALLHYWLLKMRGGEMVLEEFCRLFPEAKIFTHAFVPEQLSPTLRSRKVEESLIARLPLGRRHCQKFLPLMPTALKKWDFSDYDLLVSSESGPVKGIRKPAGCRHICYCHTPMRYLWDMYDEYYANAGILGKAAMRIFRDYLRAYDLRSAETVDTFVANSNFVKERIRRIYDRDAVVIHPPVDVEFFAAAPKKERSYFLYVGQLVCYKQPMTAIKAFAHFPEESMIVVGDGPQREELEKVATSNVKFRDWSNREQLRELYAGAKALIFPGIEDFGIIPVEAQSAGCPVIALNAGGALETVENRKTGLFFDSLPSLLEAIDEIRTLSFSADDFTRNTARFSSDRFRRDFSQLLQGEISTAGTVAR